ncbi:DUF6491 family protein [Larkinella terrae]|uniref:Lipoprotein n=1 Tax=Larkinella terrae TaxID=2025311 RepID=A0A7K0EEM2_9BACT|nr:DUF6491 family protein [Larkinella terrae]MRS60290.1 hypothetical protein [Larkinella terrae]
MRALLVFITFLGLYACQSNKTNEESTQQDTTVIAAQDAADVAAQKYFVITSWTTTDRNKAITHIQNQQKQLMELWNKGIVENIYYDQKGKFADNEPLSVVAFFIKASTEDAAHLALDTTDLVKNNLADYSLRPVGQRVFDRSKKAMNLASKANRVYAVIWAFLVERDKLDTNVLREQAIRNEKLEQEGVLENGYIDLNSLSANSGGTQPGIYFINAKNEVDARKVLDTMPLVTSKQAAYGLRNVGQFLAGVKE